jgi:hypothetical protein
MDKSFKAMFGGTADALIAISVVCCVLPMIFAVLNTILGGGR